MEQRRVGRPERQRDEGVRLVAGGADRVEAELRRLQPARRVVDRAALDARAPGERRLRRQLDVVALAVERPQPVEQVLLERVEIVAHGGRCRPRRYASSPREPVLPARRENSRARSSRRAPRRGAARRRGRPVSPPDDLALLVADHEPQAARRGRSRSARCRGCAPGRRAARERMPRERHRSPFSICRTIPSAELLDVGSTREPPTSSATSSAAPRSRPGRLRVDRLPPDACSVATQDPRAPVTQRIAVSGNTAPPAKRSSRYGREVEARVARRAARRPRSARPREPA